jgi:O-antigen/teichoic acid export membrane protein
MLALALMANTLAPTEFGLVVLLHTYVLAIRGFLNFRTFEAVVKYGVPLQANGDSDSFRKLLRITSSVDVTSGIVATLLGVGAAAITGKFLHWDEQMVVIAAFYSLTLMSTATGTPNGILRVYDRFDILGIWYTISPAIRFTGVLIAWFVDAKMLVFVGIWATAFVFENMWTPGDTPPYVRIDLAWFSSGGTARNDPRFPPFPGCYLLADERRSVAETPGRADCRQSVGSCRGRYVQTGQ